MKFNLIYHTVVSIAISHVLHYTRNWISLHLDQIAVLLVTFTLADLPWHADIYLAFIRMSRMYCCPQTEVRGDPLLELRFLSCANSVAVQ